MWIATALAWFLAPSYATACTTNWTNAAGGDWSDPANWSSGVPDASDDACITPDATYTVTLTQAAEANSLTLGAGTGTNTHLLTHP